MATLQPNYTASSALTIVFMGFFRSIRTYCILWSSAPTSGFAVFPKTILENPAVGVARCTDFRLPSHSNSLVSEQRLKPCTDFRLPSRSHPPLSNLFSDYPPIALSQRNLMWHLPTYLTFLPSLGLPTRNIIQDNCSQRPPPHAILPTHNNILDICGRRPPTKKKKGKT